MSIMLTIKWSLMAVRLTNKQTQTKLNQLAWNMRDRPPISHTTLLGRYDNYPRPLIQWLKGSKEDQLDTIAF